MNSNQQTTAFDPIGPSDALFTALNRDHSNSSAAAIGERLAHNIVCKSREELSAMAVALDDEAGNAAIDYLTAAQESLTTRTKIVEAALCRLATVTASFNPENCVLGVPSWPFSQSAIWRPNLDRLLSISPSAAA